MDTRVRDEIIDGTIQILDMFEWDRDINEYRVKVGKIRLICRMIENVVYLLSMPPQLPNSAKLRKSLEKLQQKSVESTKHTQQVMIIEVNLVRSELICYIKGWIEEAYSSPVPTPISTPSIE